MQLARGIGKVHRVRLSRCIERDESKGEVGSLVVAGEWRAKRTSFSFPLDDTSRPRILDDDFEQGEFVRHNPDARRASRASTLGQERANVRIALANDCGTPG